MKRNSFIKKQLSTLEQANLFVCQIDILLYAFFVCWLQIIQPYLYNNQR